MNASAPRSARGSEIPALVKSHLRFAKRHPVGPGASLVGVTLAVLAVVAVHLVSQSIRGSLDDPSIGGHTHVATHPALAESDYFELRRTWRVASARSVEGDTRHSTGTMQAVEAMFPVIEGFVEIAGQPRRIIGFDPVAAAMGGSDGNQAGWRGVGALRGEGFDRFLVDDVVVAAPVIARDIAADGGVIGGVPVIVIEAPAEVIFADLPTAQKLLDRDTEIDAVWLRVAGVGTRIVDWLDRLLPGIVASLPRHANPLIEGYTVTAASRWNPSRRFADAIIFNLGMLSLLCVFMAAFIAFQASASNAARRRTEQARLLAIGVAPATLRFTACAEGLVLGAVGTAVGIGLGLAVADALLQSAGGTSTGAGAGTTTVPRVLPLDGWVVGKAIACGVLVSTLGPLAEGRFKAKAWFRIGFGLLAGAVAVLGIANGSLGAAFLALAAVCAVQIVNIVPLAGAAAGRLAVVGRTLTMRSNLRATAARSSEIRLALGALSVAAAVAIGMSLMVESLRRDFTEMLDVRLAHGIYVDAGNDMAASDIDAIRALPGVLGVHRYGDLRARLPEGPVDVRLAQLNAGETARYGFDGALPDRAMMNEVGARRYGIEAGDVVTVATGGARVEVEIAHVFRDFGAAMPRIILALDFHSELDAEAVRWHRVSVAASPHALDAVNATLSERYGAAGVRNESQIRALAITVFDRTFVVSRSLTVLALVVAAIGLYAALTALQASRTREFRLLSAVGLSRTELMRLAMSQTVALGATAVLAAVPLGIVIAWILCDFVNPAAFGWSIDLRLDTASVAVPVVLGIASAVAAGAIPAYRATFRGES